MMPDRITARIMLRLSVVISSGLVVRSAVRPGLLVLPVEALQGAAQILDHRREIPAQGRAAPDQHIIMVRSHRHGAAGPHHLAKPAADAVALDGRAVLFGDGETDPDRTQIVAAAAL